MMVERLSVSTTLVTFLIFGQNKNKNQNKNDLRLTAFVIRT